MRVPYAALLRIVWLSIFHMVRVTLKIALTEGGVGRSEIAAAAESNRTVTEAATLSQHAHR